MSSAISHSDGCGWDPACRLWCNANRRAADWTPASRWAARLAGNDVSYMWFSGGRIPLTHVTAKCNTGVHNQQDVSLVIVQPMRFAGVMLDYRR
jgi:hypothetical protein